MAAKFKAGDQAFWLPPYDHEAYVVEVLGNIAPGWYAIKLSEEVSKAVYFKKPVETVGATSLLHLDDPRIPPLKKIMEEAARIEEMGKGINNQYRELQKQARAIIRGKPA